MLEMKKLFLESFDLEIPPRQISENKYPKQISETHLHLKTARAVHDFAILTQSPELQVLNMKHCFKLSNFCFKLSKK